MKNYRYLNKYFRYFTWTRFILNENVLKYVFCFGDKLYSPIVFLLTLLITYSTAYFSQNYTPGNNVKYPLGWLGWWDQSQYYKSANAFFRGDFSSSNHWYPFGYDLIVTPFVGLGSHIFFLPGFFLLLCSSLLVLKISEFYELPKGMSLIALVAGLCPSWIIFKQHAIPWNTSLAMLLLAAATYAFLRITNGDYSIRTMSVLSCSTVAMAFTRPIDLLPILVLSGSGLAIPAYAAFTNRGNRQPVLSMTIAITLSLVVLILGLIIHISIYGWGPSDYMKISAKTGVLIQKIPFSAYTIYISSQDFYGGGVGIFIFVPWLILYTIGLLYVCFLYPKYAPVNVSVMVMIASYLAYADWWPGNVWRYYLVHYIVWPILLSSFFAIVMIRDWIRSRSLIRICVLPVAVCVFLPWKLSAIPVLPAKINASSQQVMTVLQERSQLRGFKFEAGSFSGASSIRNIILELDGKPISTETDYHIISSRGWIYVVFNLQQSFSTLVMKSPPDSRFSENTLVVPIKQVFDWRRVTDFNYPEDTFMP